LQRYLCRAGQASENGDICARPAFRPWVRCGSAAGVRLAYQVVAVRIYFPMSLLIEQLTN